MRAWGRGRRKTPLAKSIKNLALVLFHAGLTLSVKHHVLNITWMYANAEGIQMNSILPQPKKSHTFAGD